MKKSMKLFGLLAILFLASLSLTGCGSKEEEATPIEELEQPPSGIQNQLNTSDQQNNANLDGNQNSAGLTPAKTNLQNVDVDKLLNDLDKEAPAQSLDTINDDDLNKI